MVFPFVAQQSQQSDPTVQKDARPMALAPSDGRLSLPELMRNRWNQQDPAAGTTALSDNYASPKSRSQEQEQRQQNAVFCP